MKNFLYFNNIARNLDRVHLQTPPVNAEYFTDITGIKPKYKDTLNVIFGIEIFFNKSEKRDDVIWSHNGIKFALNRLEYEKNNAISHNVIKCEECPYESAKKAFEMAELLIKEKTGLTVNEYIKKEKKGIYHDFIVKLHGSLPSAFTRKELISAARTVLKTYNEQEKDNIDTILFNNFINLYIPENNKILDLKLPEEKINNLINGLTKDIKAFEKHITKNKNKTLENNIGR